MHTIIQSDTRQKIELIDNLASFDREEGDTLTPRQQRQRTHLRNSVCTVQRPDGAMPVLRTLQTSACERNCGYCPFRAGRNRTTRVSFSADELAGEFDRMQRAGVVKGLFLSSGIIGGGMRAMDKLLDTVTILRQKYHYRGYVHLKIMPGAEEAQVDQALRLADRISINLEGANRDRLAFLAPQKGMLEELLPAMRWARSLRENRPDWLKMGSMVTQFVVGPAGESDRELLTGADWLYRKVGLARAYYSAFRPVVETPLAHHPATPIRREHRLYQADWLLRFYGFQLDELPFDANGVLPTQADPKLLWATQNLADQPIELNQADRAHLLRVPGIGPKGADALLAARRQHKLTALSNLSALGIDARRAGPFILLNGKRPPYQLPLPIE